MPETIPRCPACSWSLRFRERYRRWEAYCWNPFCRREVIALSQTPHVVLDHAGNVVSPGAPQPKEM